MKKPLAQDAYDELAEKYAELSDIKPHNAYYDRPAMKSLIGDVSGSLILDAGCGPGAYTEWFLSKGADVIAIDANKRMLSCAKERNGKRARYYHANLEEPLDFMKDSSIDGILSALTINYIKDLNQLFEEFYRILRKGGWFVFSTEHPFFSYKYFELDNYFETQKIGCTWTGFGKKVYVPEYYHSLGTLSECLTNSGFMIEKILEPKPTEEFKQADPDGYERLMKLPGFICFRSYKSKHIE